MRFTTICPQCNGSGEIELGEYEPDTGYPKTALCPCCFGEGEVAEHHDITAPLVGKTFQALSGNRCRVVRLDDDAIRAVWKTPSSAADKAEFLAWVESLVGPVEATVVDGRKTSESEALAKWKAAQ